MSIPQLCTLNILSSARHTANILVSYIFSFESLNLNLHRVCKTTEAYEAWVSHNRNLSHVGLVCFANLVVPLNILFDHDMIHMQEFFDHVILRMSILSFLKMKGGKKQKKKPLLHFMRGICPAKICFYTVTIRKFLWHMSMLRSRTRILEWNISFFLASTHYNHFLRSSFPAPTFYLSITFKTQTSVQNVQRHVWLFPIHCKL